MSRLYTRRQRPINREHPINRQLWCCAEEHGTGQQCCVPASVLLERARIGWLPLRTLRRISPDGSSAHCSSFGSFLPGSGTCTARHVAAACASAVACCGSEIRATAFQSPSAPKPFFMPVCTIIAGISWKNATQTTAIIVRLTPGGHDQPAVLRGVLLVLQLHTGSRARIELDVSLRE